MSAPKNIVIDKDSRVVRIDLTSGETIKLSHFLLRVRCACADCKAAELQGKERSIDPRVWITAAQPVGSYALQLNFSDGHERGIYPWEYLEALVREENTSSSEHAESTFTRTQ